MPDRIVRLSYNMIWLHNYCLDEHGGGTPIILSKNGGDYQKWWLYDLGDAVFQLRSVRSGNVLDSNFNGDVYTLPLNGG